jgi:transcriptional accessory protein Tex/SPT6
MTNTISEAGQIKIVQLIAKELGVGPHQVAAAVALLDEGSTVPFIARYRKEATGNLDDTHLRNLDERLLYLRELEERRAVILASIEEQGKLTDELRGAIVTAATKQALEDIYLPYKPKRRTRAQIAREAGLEPLADSLFADPTLDPQQEAAKHVNVTLLPKQQRHKRSRRPSRTRWRARDSLRAFCRDRRAPRQTACAPVGAGHRYVHGDERQGDGRGRKIPRLLRLFRGHTHHPLASRPRAVPR